MSLIPQYADLRKRVADLLGRMERLDPKSDKLQTEFSLLLGIAAKLRSAIVAHVDAHPEAKMPGNCGEIISLLEALDRESGERQKHVRQRESVIELTARLKQSRYEHRSIAMAAAGEQIRQQAISATEESVDDPDRCRALCGDVDASEGLLESWSKLNEGEQEALICGWPNELEPVAELIKNLDGLRIAPDLEPAGDALPVSEPETGREKERPEPNAADTADPERTVGPVSLTDSATSGDTTPPEKNRNRRRANLRRSIAPLWGTRDIFDEIDEISTAGGEDFADLINPVTDGATDAKPSKMAPADLIGNANRGTTAATESSIVATEDIVAGPPADHVASEQQTQVLERERDREPDTRVAPVPGELGREQPDGEELGAEAFSTAEQKEAAEDLSMTETDRDFDPAKVCDLAWEAIASDRFSLAYCTLRAASQVISENACMPPEIASVALLSQLVETNSTEIADRLKRDLNLVQDHLRGNVDASGWSQRLLVSSSSLRPALIAPITDAVSLLSDSFFPSDVLPGYADVCRTIARYGTHRLKIDPAMLTGARELAEWKEQFESQLDSLNQWWQSEQCAKVIYAHTTNVWHHWLREDEIIGGKIQAILDAGARARPLIEAFVADWSDDRDIARRCKTTDGEKRGRGAKRRPIDGRALQALRQKIRFLCDQLESLRVKIEATPEADNDFVHTEVMKCRDGVLSSIDRALAELREYRSGGSHAAHVFAAIDAASENLGEVKRMFTEPRPIRPFSEQVSQLLTADLALVPGISATLHATDESLRLDSSDLQALLTAIEHPLTEEDAFESHTKSHNHAAAERLLRKIESDSKRGAVAETLRRQHEEAIAADRLQLRSIAIETEQEIDKAVCYDLVDETTRQKLAGEVTNLEGVIESELNLSSLFTSFTRIADELDRLREARLSEVKRRFDELKAGEKTYRSEDLQRIELTLQQRDFSTADEYINLVRNGQQLDGDATKGEQIFDAFFGKFLPSIEAHLQQHPSEQLKTWTEQLDGDQTIVFGSAFGQQDHRLHARNLIETWRRLLRIRKSEEKRTQHARLLFSHVGFGNVEVKHLRHGTGWSLDSVAGEQVANRRVCAIPQFGSSAKGLYHLLSIDGKLKDPDVEKLLSDAAVATQGSDVPLIVLFCGRLPKARRRSMAKLCWGTHQFLLVDELLVLFLATRQDGHQRAFFECTLPFTSSQPYSTTASFVPIEMFFGRTEEYKAIVSRDPTHLVFGGRQLGKSVLLREAERQLHNPKKGRVVRWIDLKNRGIGTQRPPSELWDEIGKCLHENGVLKVAASREGTIRSAVQAWLGQDPARTVLLLLDEADEFLNQDSQPLEGARQIAFPVVSQIKGLMDDTERRFKVVFAGLHNVQRAAKDKNTPIGHLGTSINIGPLIDKGEWKQAKALIEVPMRQMGFVFESPDLVTRILSHTNFYPSLIQIFCRHLLRSLHTRGKGLIDFRNSPPYVVSMNEIERVYQSEELQVEVRDRFELTLNLDDRYRLIALLIAFQTIEMREDGEPLRGLTLREIYQKAMGWWSEGFAQDRSFDGFGILLDEMVGLGVLRHDPDGKYALRSANVLNLMGSKDRIEMGLYDVADSPPPSEYAASTFRRSLCDDPVRRSPLTSQQEGRLLSRANAATLLSGCPLAVLGDLKEAFDSLNKSDVHVFTYEEQGSVNDLMEWIDEKRHGREGLSIVIIPTCVKWSQAWIQAVHQRLAKKKSATKNFVRVIFVADPPKRWNVRIDEALLSRIERIQLHPWTHSILDRWLDDNSFKRDQDRVKQLLDVSGGWGMLIQQLAEKCGDEKHLWLEKLKNLGKEWPVSTVQDDLLQLPAEPNRFLADWVNLGDTEEVEFEILEELAGESDAETIIDWAAEFSYIEPGRDGTWKLNPMVAESLKTVAAK